MTSTTKKGALALGGAVALASAAFAIGSQAGGGNAVAESVGASSTAPASAPAFREVHRGGPGGPRGAFLDDLAQKLGVSEEKLRTALEDVRPDRPDPDEHVAELAKALGISEAKVREAFDKLQAAGPRAGAGPPDSLVEGVAKDLGVSEAKAREALEKHWPQGVRLRGPGPRGGGRAELAKALGVSEDKLTDAMTKLRDQKRAEFAKALAAKLGISPDKVQEALRDFPHPGLRGPR